MIDKPCTPAEIAAFEERRQKFRIAAQRLVDDHRQRRKVDPHALEWALGILSKFKPKVNR